MWDLKLCEKEPAALADAMLRRGIGKHHQVADLADKLQERKRLIAAMDAANTERRRAAVVRGGSREDARDLREQTANLREELTATENAIQALASALPNCAHATVPDGTGENDNVIMKTWGEPRHFDFPIKDHVDLGAGTGILDLPRGTRLAATGFPCLKGLGARLNRAIINFMLDVHRERRGLRRGCTALRREPLRSLARDSSQNSRRTSIGPKAASSVSCPPPRYRSQICTPEKYSTRVIFRFG